MAKKKKKEEERRKEGGKGEGRKKLSPKFSMVMVILLTHTIPS